MGKTAKEMVRDQVEAEVNRFNLLHPIGTAVQYTNDFGKVYNTRTASKAFVNEGFRVVVHLDDVHRAIDICRVKTGA